MGDRGYDSKASLSAEGLSLYRAHYDAIRWDDEVSCVEDTVGTFEDVLKLFCPGVRFVSVEGDNAD